jgi:hypothetical protein
VIVAGLVAVAFGASAATGHWSARSLAIVLTVVGLGIVIAAYMINVRVEVTS